jgi:hypothetical protein
LVGKGINVMAPSSEDERVSARLLQAQVESQGLILREMKAEIKALHQAIADRDRALDAREAERLRQERQVLWTGMKTLLWVLGGMALLIWGYRAVIIGTSPMN